MFEFLYDWVIDFINTLGNVWEWLITDTTILGYELPPIQLALGGMFIVGLLRAITGVL